MAERYVIYYRVSTTKQGENGLGMQAQRTTVMNFLNGGKHDIVGEYSEVMSGGKDNRPELQKALRDCELKNARLIVAKLDRLSRDLHFITELQKSGVRFTVAELPDANELTIHIYAAMAQHERKIIGQRTKAALAPLKGTGKLGNPCFREGKQIEGSGNTTNARSARKENTAVYANKMLPIIKDIQADGASSLRQIAKALNESGYRTYSGKEWQAMTVSRLLKRAA